MREQRRLAAIVSADVAGYSRLMRGIRSARLRAFLTAREKDLILGDTCAAFYGIAK